VAVVEAKRAAAAVVESKREGHVEDIRA